MMEKLDDIDREILKILQKDAKTVAKSIAEQLGLPKLRFMSVLKD